MSTHQVRTAGTKEHLAFPVPDDVIVHALGSGHMAAGGGTDLKRLLRAGGLLVVGEVSARGR